MRSWNKRSVELSLTPREAELLSSWLETTCKDRQQDAVGFRLSAVLKIALAPQED